MASGKKFYWLKLSKDFFKRHDVRIIESQENGKDYVLFYLKLLAESITHEGELRFSDTIPYDDKMLATITNTNVDVVRQAIKIFTGLNLMEILDNDTIYMNETQKMMGFETDWAKKKRQQREKIKGDNVPQLSTSSPHDVRQEKEKELDKELELEKEKDMAKTKKDIELSFEEVWKLYPNKQGKKQVNKKAKKRIYENKEEMIRCVKRYIEHKKSQKNGMDFLLNGSTFFNTRYFDYTDKAYKDTMSHVNNRKNNNSPQDIPDDDSWGGMKV